MYPILFIVGLILLWGSIFRVQEVPKQIQQNSQISNLSIGFGDADAFYDKFIGKYFTEEEVELAKRYKWRINTPVFFLNLPILETICTYEERMAIGYLQWRQEKCNKIPGEYIMAENQRREFPTKEIVSYLKSGIRNLQDDMDSLIKKSIKEQELIIPWNSSKDKELFLIDILGAANYNGFYKHVVLYNNPYPGEEKPKGKVLGSQRYHLDWDKMFASEPKVKGRADIIYGKVSEKSHYYLEICMNNYDKGYWKFNPLPPYLARDYVFQQVQQITEPRLQKVSHEGEWDKHFAMREKIKAKCEELGLMEWHKYATPLEELDPNGKFKILNNMFCPESQLPEPWKLDVESSYYM